MSRTHRRIQDGGNPAQGPVPELANEPRSPRDVDELPDRPEDNQPGHEPRRDEDQPDPDAFAERLGLVDHDDDSADTAEGGITDTVTDTAADTAGAAAGRARRIGASALSGLGRAAGAAERSLSRWAGRLRS